MEMGMGSPLLMDENIKWELGSGQVSQFSGGKIVEMKHGP
jgi:hypothetical protein